jgi:hypothetical protein
MWNTDSGDSDNLSQRRTHISHDIGPPYHSPLTPLKLVSVISHKIHYVAHENCIVNTELRNTAKLRGNASVTLLP